MKLWTTVAVGFALILSACAPDSGNGSVTAASAGEDFVSHLERFEAGLRAVNGVLGERETEAQGGGELGSSGGAVDRPFSTYVESLSSEERRSVAEALRAEEWDSADTWATFGDDLARLYVWRQLASERRRIEGRVAELEEVASSNAATKTAASELVALRQVLAELPNVAQPLSADEQELATTYEPQIASAFQALQELETN